MARRTFDVPNVTEILVHWDAGRSQSEIATSLGPDRKTVKKYLTPAIESGLSPGSGRMQLEWSMLVRDWFPAAGRHRAAAGVLAVDRAAPGLHSRPA